jgi:hypothetical protein
MSQKNRNKNISEDKSFFIRLSKIKELTLAINTIKRYKDKKLIERNFSKILNNPMYKSKIVGIDFPQEYKNMESVKLIYKDNLENEIWWNLLIIKHYKKELSRFINMKIEFLTNLFYGNYEEAELKLLDINEVFGLSNWYIENKLLLLSKQKGLKEQKIYLNEVRKDAPATTSLLSYYFSLRLEPNLSFSEFNKSFTKFWEEHTNIRNYFYIKCNPLLTKIDKLEDFIYDENKSSIIDIYISIVKAFYIIATEEKQYSLPDKTINKFIKQLSSITDDLEIKSLLYKQLGINQTDHSILKYVQALDLYTEGNYNESFILCKELILNKSYYWINIIELLVKSELRCDKCEIEKDLLKEDTVIYHIYNCFKSILLRDNKLLFSVDKLFKFSLEFSSYNISNSILLFIHNNLQFYPEVFDPCVLKKAKLDSILYDIRNRNILDEEKSNNLILDYLNKYPDSITYKFIYSPENYKEIPIYRINKYLLQDINCKLTANEKIAIYRDIICNAHILDRYEAIIKLTILLFKEKKIIESIECLVDGYFQNNNLVYSLPLKEITEYVAQFHKFDFKNNICVPIIYNLYSKYISFELDKKKNIRYEMFIESTKFNRPTKFISNYTDSSKEKIEYFLEYNCNMTTLDSSMHIDDTEDVEKERIAICQYLVEQNSKSTEKLLKEIKNITEASIISRFIKEIEQNKIYVNIDGIKLKLNSTLMEYYLRYINLVNNVDDLRRKLISQYILNKNFNKENKYPDNDIMPLLNNIIKEIKEHFVFSSEYGLAAYLSTNIRHGKMYNFLTSSLLSSNLLLKKDNLFLFEHFKN